MDHRRATVIFLASLTGASVAQGAGIASADILGRAETVGHQQQTVEQFVGFLLSDDLDSMKVSGDVIVAAAPETGANHVVLNLGGLDFDGSAIRDRLASSTEQQGDIANASDDGSFRLRTTLNPTVGTMLDDGGIGHLATVPLPAPVALAGVGLLSIGGLSMWKRRIHVA